MDTLRASIQPSIFRRMSLILDSTNENERVFLLRWSGNVDIDPDALLNLTNET